MGRHETLSGFSEIFCKTQQKAGQDDTALHCVIRVFGDGYFWHGGNGNAGPAYPGGEN